jgi:hypothetical protein
MAWDISRILLALTGKRRRGAGVVEAMKCAQRRMAASVEQLLSVMRKQRNSTAGKASAQGAQSASH